MIAVIVFTILSRSSIEGIWVYESKLQFHIYASIVRCNYCYQKREVECFLYCIFEEVVRSTIHLLSKSFNGRHTCKRTNLKHIVYRVSVNVVVLFDRDTVITRTKALIDLVLNCALFSWTGLLLKMWITVRVDTLGFITLWDWSLSCYINISHSIFLSRIPFFCVLQISDWQL